MRLRFSTSVAPAGNMRQSNACRSLGRAGKTESTQRAKRMSDTNTRNVVTSITTRKGRQTHGCLPRSPGGRISSSALAFAALDDRRGPASEPRVLAGRWGRGLCERWGWGCDARGKLDVRLVRRCSCVGRV